MISEFEYLVPERAADAAEYLHDHREQARIIGGGTDLVIGLRNRELAPGYLVDISGIEELRGIDELGERISVGAACTHTEISEAPVLRAYAEVLCNAAKRIGSHQIRNLGTIGGNVANGSPAADTIPALMVLNADLILVSVDGERQVDLASVYEGPYRMNIGADTLISRIIIDKVPPKTGQRFFRVARRKAVAPARINGAVLLRRGMGGGGIEDIRISLGSVTPVPCRMTEAERFLTGINPSEAEIEKACELIVQKILDLNGNRRSMDYKGPVVKNLVGRAIRDLWTGQDEIQK